MCIRDRFEIIKNAADLGFKLIITTDHGTINVKNPTKIIGDRNSSQNLRYKTGRSLTSSEKDNLIYNNPHNILLPKKTQGTNNIKENKKLTRIDDGINKFALSYTSAA